MSLESGLVTALSGLAGGRIYPAPAPRDAISPFITYQVISVAPFERVTDPALKPHDRVSIQIDCYAEDSSSGTGSSSIGYGDAVTLAQSVRNTFFNAAGDYDGADVIDIEFADWNDLPEDGPNGPIWRRSVSFVFIVRN